MIITEETWKKWNFSNIEDAIKLAESGIPAANLLIDGIKDCFSGDQLSCTDSQLLNLLKQHIKKYYFFPLLCSYLNKH